MWLIKKLGSIRFTIFISIFFMIVLIVSTVVESRYGTTLAQKLFYQTKWFDFVLSLFWINILCATLLRFPFKKRNIGFLVTHIGILGLLMGALATRLFAVEGQMVIFESEASDKITMGQYYIKVDSPNQDPFSFDLAEGKYEIPAPQGFLPSDKAFCPIEEPKDTKEDDAITKLPSQERLNFSINRILEYATEEFNITQGTKASPLNHAVKVEIRNQTIGMNRALWLVENHPKNPRSDIEHAGPIEVILKTHDDIGDIPILQISNKAGEGLGLINLAEPSPEVIPLENSDLKIKNLRYYPYAKVVENKLANIPESGSQNPAVEFDVFDSSGKIKHYIEFALFPHFDSMHKRTSEVDFDIVAEIGSVNESHHHHQAGPSLTFSVSNNEWRFKSQSEDQHIEESTVEINKWFPIGKMGTEFRVKELLNNAAVISEFKESPNPGQGTLAAEIIVSRGKESLSKWVQRDRKIIFRTEQGDLQVGLLSKEEKLPFYLYLHDFRKIDYPGTNNPAAFESDVTLHDPKERVKISKTISMNNPLDYKGFRIFQSSFIQNPSYGEASIFTIAKNPGIILIYISSFIIFAGAALQFYTKSF